MKRSLLLLTAVVLSVGACASTPSEFGSRERNVLSAAEIAEANVNTAYEAIARLRPRFLQDRGPDLYGEELLAVVYVNGSRFGHINTLHSVRADVIQEIRYLNGRDATTRFGMNHGGGAIIVTVGTHGT